MDLSVPHRHTETGLLFISFVVIFFYSPCIDSCVKPSSSKKTLRKANSDCEERSGSLLGPNYLIRQRNPSLIGNVKAFVKKHPIWFDDDIDEAPCKVLSSNDSHNATFEDKHYYLCFFNDTDGLCKQNTTATSSTSSTTASSTKPNATSGTFLVSTSPTALDSSIILSIVIPAIVLLIVIAIAAGCFVIKRSGKRIKNAVKEEGGGNLEPENQTREAYQIPLNDIIVRSEEVEEDPEEETYNILRLSSKNGSESPVTESNGKKIYDHLRFGEKEGDYDTTCLSRLDGGPVDKPYDKTYFG